VLDDQLNGRRFVFDQLLPYLVSQGYPLSDIRMTGAEWPVARRPISADPALVNRLLTDPRFRALIEARYQLWWHARGEYEAALAATSAILSDIDRVR
jgi:hypothetical protein